MLHSSSGVIVKNKLFRPEWSSIAKQQHLAYFAALSVCPMALHDVEIALNNHLLDGNDSNDSDDEINDELKGSNEDDEYSDEDEDEDE